MMQPKNARRNSRIQGTGESRVFRLELRDLTLGSFNMRLRERGVSAAAGWERYGARRPQTGTDGLGRTPFQALRRSRELSNYSLQSLQSYFLQSE